MGGGLSSTFATPIRRLRFSLTDTPQGLPLARNFQTDDRKTAEPRLTSQLSNNSCLDFGSESEDEDPATTPTPRRREEDLVQGFQSLYVNQRPGEPAFGDLGPRRAPRS